MLIFRACEPTGRAPFWETGVANPLWCSCLGRGMRTPCAHVWAGECEPDVPGSFLGGECEPKARAHVWAGEREPAVPGSFLAGNANPKPVLMFGQGSANPLSQAHFWRGMQTQNPCSCLGRGVRTRCARLIFGRGVRTQSQPHFWAGNANPSPCSSLVGIANLKPVLILGGGCEPLAFLQEGRTSQCRRFSRGRGRPLCSSVARSGRRRSAVGGGPGNFRRTRVGWAPRKRGKKNFSNERMKEENATAHHITTRTGPPWAHAFIILGVD